MITFAAIFPAANSSVERLRVTWKEDEEKVCCHKALTLDHGNVDVLYNKAVAFGKLGDYIQAIKNYDQALAVDPNNAGALAGKGFALHQLGNNDQAIIYYDKALALDPTTIEPNLQDAIVGKRLSLGALNQTQSK